MTGPPRDWDKELAKIDQLMAKGPAPPAPVAGGGRPASPSPAHAPAPPRGGSLPVWIRVLLGVAAGAALTQWPYGRECGTPLFLYTGAAGVVVLAGVYAAAASWRRRIALAHVIALLVALWGLVLVAAVVLPRIGYARVGAAWLCP